ncbi:hypothetical protein BVY01_00280, partial [bacterium I07]
MKKIAIFLGLLPAFIFGNGNYTESAMLKDDIKYGVYIKVMEIPGGSFDEVCEEIETAITSSEFTMSGQWELDTVDPHDYRSKVFVLNLRSFTNRVAELEGQRFLSVAQRICVYEGAGRKSIIVNMTNPDAIARVYFHGTEQNVYDEFLELSQKMKDAMLTLIQEAADGKYINEQMNPQRSEKSLNGYNGDGPAKVMAMFKDFMKSLKDIQSKKTGDDVNESFKASCALFEKNIEKSKEGWKIIYSIEAGQTRRCYGISRAHTEELSTRIVGEKRDSKDDPAPGIDHSPAFPIE